jgi:hypothetical protein
MHTGRGQLRAGFVLACASADGYDIGVATRRPGFRAGREMPALRRAIRPARRVVVMPRRTSAAGIPHSMTRRYRPTSRRAPLAGDIELLRREAAQVAAVIERNEQDPHRTRVPDPRPAIDERGPRRDNCAPLPASATPADVGFLHPAERCAMLQPAHGSPQTAASAFHQSLQHLVGIPFTNPRRSITIVDGS